MKYSHPAETAKTKTAHSEKLHVPLWFYLLALIGLLWNIMGLMAFMVQVTITPDMLAHMVPAQRDLYLSTPVWLDIVFAIAVFSGLLASLLLLLKKAVAYVVFRLSLIAVLVQFAYVLGVQQAASIVGSSAFIMPAIVISVSVFFIFLCRFSLTKHWLS